MNDNEWLAGQFDAHRGHLRAVAYRMLGSLAEADDAVQEAWLKLSRADAGDVRNLGGWLTTVVGRVCLDMLRSRTSRREEFPERMPDPIIDDGSGSHPEHQALIADSVGLALLVVLDTLDPAERLALVLHDMFALPFDEIAPIVDRTPAAARQLASRARRRVQGAPTVPDSDVSRQREVVNAFFAAARDGDFAALVAVLDPDVVLRSESPTLPAGAARVVRGAEAVAGQALLFRGTGAGGVPVPVLVNGVAGQLVTRDGKPQTLFAFTVVDNRIAAIDIISAPDRLADLW
ncbi:sigma-70 family RNA polymerase sigma factor [Amycolatopsis thermophila]|uniref:RNA polymerase sigma-70 factor (ECF subfamily) n=1 Tax=Amycolatopsis thermophila TaxID=206084 RepID=A0ABU0EP57_9PSEU|nr:sigma-70 family RNA polymerase sigma factor [Amycolatopsis thermophila]MDQ0377074.1 RNA polymerase sigma-70 factor (ECF subfamily) [Amycolatopsis thermophila]